VVVRVGVLGPVEATLDGAPLDLGTPKQRALVAALALTPGQPVSVDTIVDLLWADAAPAAVTGTLQGYVSVLRRTLEPAREKRTPASVLVTVAPGYALRLANDCLDARVLESAVAAQHRRLTGPLLGPSPLDVVELHDAVARLDAALGLWRGRPYAELEDAPAAVAERAHLEELRMVALEDRAVARLALGEHATAAAELEALTVAHPLRERLWALRTLALVRSGRQAEALEVLRGVRELLADELGLDPGAELRDLQERVLRQDPSLTWSEPAPTTGGGEVRTTDHPAGPADERSVPAPVSPASPWPLLGRDDELRAMRSALTDVRAGRPGYVLLTGEPGIGKSRLAAEIAALARAYGHVVAVGRCSQDDGAPPLWPWRTVFDTLGADQSLDPSESTGATTEGADFRSWENIARRLRDFAAERPLTVVLEDLHWADTATLRVLRLLTEIDAEVPLLVVLTWRGRPTPVGALADLSEALGRRQALRLELGGVDVAAVGAMVSVVTRRRIAPELARTMRDRTDGNPFFLIEYARAWRTDTDLEDLLSADPPSAVREAIERRLARLPEESRAALGTAAIIGRRFDVATLADATGEDPEDLLDRLEPAQAAGLVHESGIDTFAFDHALVRDTVYGLQSKSRRAKRHAQVADALAGRPGRETEAAHHLLAAGPARAGEAWRAAVAAAEVALAANAYPEAAELYRRALAAQEGDQHGGPRDRYDVLMGLVTAYRWSASWPLLTATVEDAIRVAEGLGDPVLVAEAAIATTRGALWQSAHYGHIHHEIIAALRRSLAALPDEDSDLRCRCLLSLGAELYYASTFEERRAVTDEGLAMAGRLGDPDLRLHAALVASTALWTPSTADERLELSEEALSVAREIGAEHDEMVAGAMQAIVLGELGRPREMWRVVEATRERAVRLRLVYSVLALDSMVVPWLCLAGRFDEAEARLISTIDLASQSALRHADDAIQGNFLTLAMWRDDFVAPEELVAALEAMVFPMTATVAFTLWRAGQEERALTYMTQHEVDLAPDDWFTLLNHCYAGAMAAYSEDAELGASVYGLLAPYAGRSCCAGSGVASGPVDAYLALAALSTGERELATRHADDAERLAAEWRIPVFTAWLREQRDRYSF